MSQNEIGKLLSIHDAVIGRYERDEVKPSIEMATHWQKLCKCLRIIDGMLTKSKFKDFFNNNVAAL